MVKSTSTEAYIAHKTSGKLSKQELIVIKALNKPKTSRELAHITGLERSSVCGRINSLVSKLLVVEHDTMMCPVTNKKVHRYVKASL